MVLILVYMIVVGLFRMEWESIMRYRYRMRDIMRLFGYFGGIGSIIVLLGSQAVSVFSGFKVIIFTNQFSECFFEMVLLSVLLVCILYSFYNDFSKKKIMMKREIKN